MDQLIAQFQRAHFNGLPSVEDANTSVREGNKLKLAIAILGPIFLKYKMHNAWGISLLHKHFELEADELPIQVVKEQEYIRSYITTPKTISHATDFYPAIIQVDNRDSFIALEFSTDTSALLANRDLDNSPAFVNEIREALIENQLINDFGLIYGKTFNHNYELVEINYSERISVLKETLPTEVDFTQLIQTSWFFSPDAKDASCKTKCMSGCTPGTGGSHTHSHSVYHDPNG